jgi:hypothetical protein
VVEQEDATIFVEAGDEAVVDAGGNLVIAVAGGSGGAS